jgi:hypothetical protein
VLGLPAQKRGFPGRHLRRLLPDFELRKINSERTAIINARMNLRYLCYIITVAEELSVRRAAKVVHSGAVSLRPQPDGFEFAILLLL